MKSPGEAFLIWFDSLPVHLRKFLAHFFKVGTTENAMDMVVDSTHSLNSFRLWFVKKDFPLRVAARVFLVRSMFDLVMVHRQTLLALDADIDVKDEVIQISSLQWNRAFSSWKTLRHRELSDTYVHSWTELMLKKQYATGSESDG